MSVGAKPTAATIKRAQRGRLLADLRRELARPPRHALDSGQRFVVVDTLIAVLDGLYAHLPLKRARHGIDPVQQLRRLRERCADPTYRDDAFHTDLARIVTSLRDAHTRYLGPGSLTGEVAVLPFLVETFGPDDAARYIVSRTGPQEVVGDVEFIAEVELVSWSGVAFDRAVQRWADNETGGRPDARRARAVESLTFRSLEYGPPPDEDWVIVGYRTSRTRRLREVRMPWRVLAPGMALTAVGLDDAREQRADIDAERILAVNPAAEALRRAKQLLFAPTVWADGQTVRPITRLPAVARPTRPAPPPGADEAIPTTMPDVVAARIRSAGAQRIGHLRLWSFMVNDVDAYLAEIARLLGEMADVGVCIDLRGNPGGVVWAAERLLQLFTPNEIVPTRFSVLATDLTRASAASSPVLEPWSSSLDDAVSTGEMYSQPLPLTDPSACNDLGQHHSGPIVAVVDANTYSAGDLFSAGFVDHRIGPMVCVGQATGAGGANVWTSDYVEGVLAATDRPLPVLPAGVRYTVAARRATRVGPAEGTPIEDLGVRGIPYAMTRNDLLHGNVDLLAHCAELLAGQPHTRLDMTVTDSRVSVTSSGLSDIDLRVDRRPVPAALQPDGTASALLPAPPQSVDVIGWASDTIVQRRRWRRDE